MSTLSVMFNAIKNMVKSPATRFIKSGNLKGYTALAGTNSRTGAKWTKLYNPDGELVSWKASLKGKITKGKYEKIDPFDWNKEMTTTYPRSNVKVKNIKYTGFEELPPKRYSAVKDLEDSWNPINNYNPLSSHFDSYGMNNDFMNDGFSSLF